MTSNSPERIPFAIEISRVIELLAAQIYPTPYALLRENVQNAFDAILLRKQLEQNFDPRIDVTIEPQRVTVVDNGIGMTKDDLRKHFWRAGSSSKNTDAARAAGVVGTFGIGAMANFGIAEELIVDTESAITGEHFVSSASRSTLSVTDDCITFEHRPSRNGPGTKVLATISARQPINVNKAVNYISPLIAYLSIPVVVNGVLKSQGLLQDAVPALSASWGFNGRNVDLGGGVTADVVLSGAVTGDLRISLEGIRTAGQALPGRMILNQGTSTLRTFRSGFGLATTSVSSAYQFGGVADFLFLEPTAGREALTTETMQRLQDIVTRVDEFVSLHLATRSESNANAFFVNWAARHRRFDLCGNLRVRLEPGDSQTLDQLRRLPQEPPLLVYSGSDPATIRHASEERPIIMLSRGSSRRECEMGFISKYCKYEELSDEPKVIKLKTQDLSAAEKAVAFRIAAILSTDYFLEAVVRFGTISHGVPLLVTSRKSPIEIFLDPGGSSLRILTGLYDHEYGAFGHMAKDFVRNMVFPRVADLVPSATKQGAEAFLKAIYRGREVFEYEATDLESLTELWKDYLSGKLTFPEAADRSTRVAVRSYQVLDISVASAVRDVVPDVIENQTVIPPAEVSGSAQPPIQRTDIETDRKLLTINDDEPPLKGYRCFLALTDRVREEKGDFFLQPHRTSVVWGGQRALFIFEHHSGEFGLYYDLQTQVPISGDSGGGSFETCTIVMKNRIFIPVPLAIQATFMPLAGERKRFEVRCDVLHIDTGKAVG